MKVLLTGASSGIGREMANEFAKRGYELIIVARDKKNLEQTKNELLNEYKVNVETITMDLSDSNNCIELFEKVKNIDILVNNAGFGDCGNFTKTSLEKDLKMIETNICAYHILTKLYLTDMKKENKGQILNVASIAGFMPGPLMTTYYATKAYVVSMCESIREELNQEKSNVKISVLCPGPVATNFEKVANVKFQIKSDSPQKIAKYAVKKFLKGKFYIVPTLDMKLAKFSNKIFSKLLIGKVMYKIQKRKLQ